jgi:hypothetical protein
VPSRPRGSKAVSTYNCSYNLGYISDLNGKQKQLIKKLVHICMINGKKTSSHAILYIKVTSLFVCLSVCPGSFRALPGPLFVFFFSCVS